ncbi:MAG: SDR family oxidoreductase [Polyangiaceae bacterium]|nr:SDR family oxidoreductase [Polyangiaceae bacterium]
MSAPVVFITGASRGIGAALAARFHRGGFVVTACARTKLESPHVHLGTECDVKSADQVKRSIASIVERFGKIDVVINNAGLAGTNVLDPDGDDSFWHEVMGVNLHGTYYVCKHALPHLPDRRGRIINIASVLGLKGVPDQTAYTAAKHGVIGFTRALAQLVAPRGITVNAICPGWTRTPMAEGRMRDLGFDEAALARSVPLGRMLEPEEVAEFAYYLASESAGGITGQALVIDGGAIG